MSNGSDVQHRSVSQCFIITADCCCSIKSALHSIVSCFSMCMPAIPIHKIPYVDTKIFAELIAVTMFILVHAHIN